MLPPMEITQIPKNDMAETYFEETGLTIDEVAKIEGYLNCIK